VVTPDGRGGASSNSPLRRDVPTTDGPGLAAATKGVAALCTCNSACSTVASLGSLASVLLPTAAAGCTAAGANAAIASSDAVDGVAVAGTEARGKGGRSPARSVTACPPPSGAPAGHCAPAACTPAALIAACPRLESPSPGAAYRYLGTLITILAPASKCSSPYKGIERSVSCLWCL
jgi:hypothetical protein